jgi:hypothetical protein
VTRAGVIASRWRKGLLVALGLFLLTRILTLTAFPIFNDEAIYLQYSQKIHDDWGKNKFISMNGEFTDWKPPLQYWMAAPFVGWGNDPLLAGRLVAFVASVAGLIGSYLFAKELFTEQEGVFAAFLYVLCPTVLFHNNQFTAETFLFSTAPFLYYAVLRLARPNKPDWVWAPIAMLVGTALLLLKESGFLLLGLSIFLPIVRLQGRQADADVPAEGMSTRQSVGERNWRQFARNVAFVIAVIVCCRIAANALLPSAFNAAREHFNNRWVLSLRELLNLPTAIWRGNLAVVADYIGSFYSWTVVLVFCVFAWFAFKRRNFAELTLVAMCAAGAMGIMFLLRGFNEYLFNTALIAVLLPLLGRAAVVISHFPQIGKAGLMRGALLFCAGLTIGYWGYQDILMGVSAGKYIERSSAWAVANYLKSWSTGFGVKAIVAALEKEKEPGIVFTDAQWGNPGTALEVYGAKRFPNLRIVPISREFLDASEARKLTDAAKKMAPIHFAIFSADSSEPRQRWLSNIQRETCETRMEVREYPSQTPIIVCRF